MLDEEYEDPKDGPLYDPDDWEVDTSVEYDLDISDPQWIVPSDNLPKEVYDPEEMTPLDEVDTAPLL